MALIHMKDGRAKPHGLQRSHAAYPQDDLLSDPHLPITPVELRRDLSSLF